MCLGEDQELHLRLAQPEGLADIQMEMLEGRWMFELASAKKVWARYGRWRVVNVELVFRAMGWVS